MSNVRAIARAVFTSLSQGRAILRQIHGWGWRTSAQRGLTPSLTSYSRELRSRLSIAATSGPLISPGVLTAAEAARLIARLDEPDFMACGFAFIGAWGRRNGSSHT